MNPSAGLGTGVVEQIRAAIEREGWGEVAERSGMHRASLWRAFHANGRGHPTLTTIERVLPHVGLELTIRRRGGE